MSGHRGVDLIDFILVIDHFIDFFIRYFKLTNFYYGYWLNLTGFQHYYNDYFNHFFLWLFTHDYSLFTVSFSTLISSRIFHRLTLESHFAEKKTSTTRNYPKSIKTLSILLIFFCYFIEIDFTFFYCFKNFLCFSKMIAFRQVLSILHSVMSLCFILISYHQYFFQLQKMHRNFTQKTFIFPFSYFPHYQKQ